MHTLDRIAVLGAGTMGSQIAAHFANAGIPSLLLDVVSPGSDRNSLSRGAIERALKRKPSPFFSSEAAQLIEAGNFDDDLPRIARCDWIIEAVTEDLSVKRALWERVVPHAGNAAILSTNTSGIQIDALAQGLPVWFRWKFLGTHFFNPPRYLHLLEIIPGRSTGGELIELVKQFGEQLLGKGIVICKDTPNFIANRIGAFYSAAIQRAMVEEEFSIEEVDALTGPLIGIPKSASFRLIDIVGLDVWLQVARNIYENTSDSWHDWFHPMPYAVQMLETNWLGEKTGQGFYQYSQTGKQGGVLDWKTLEYRPAKRASFARVEDIRRNISVVGRIRSLLSTEDKAGRFLWRVLREVFAYSLAVAPEISDSLVEIDRAMRWGFGHKLGPFELWDALGFQEIARRMESNGIDLPEMLMQLRSAGVASLYRPGEYLDVTSGTFRKLERQPGVLLLEDVRRTRGVVDGNLEASLLDLDDGVLCLEFHSKMNIIGEGTLQMMSRAVELLEGRFDALVIANGGENFSAGANLSALLQSAQTRDFVAIANFIRRFQSCLLGLKYAPKPVIAAAFSRALGGGCEVVLQSHRVQALAEFYTGLVELNVGLIPAGGGTKELAMRLSDPMKALNLIADAHVSSSAVEARKFGFLQATDRITMNPDLLVGDAKSFALDLTAHYRRGAPQKNVAVSGEDGYQRMLRHIDERKASRRASEHDAAVLEKLAYVLSGGRVPSGSSVTEERLLELELEVFLSLCGMLKTQQRIEYMLQNGKPLKN